MKIKPVLDALERRGAETVLVHTGQHYDAGMSDVFFGELGIRPPDHSLGVGSGSHAEQTARVMLAFEPLLASVGADVVVVVGDVNSTVACALVAAKAGVALAHVEAGLRSRDWAMPEEVNRVVTDRLSRFLLAPSADAVENLRAEGEPDDEIHLVGNVMVDTLLANVDRALARQAWAGYGLEPGGYGLVTLHRPANVDEPAVLGALLDALNRIASRLPLLFAVHPRTAERLADLDVAVHPSITVVPPLGYLDFLALHARSAIVLTDSGGIQEEATVLGIPCLTLRDNTERPITVELGTNRVVGRDPERIVRAATEALDGSRATASRPPLWDGQASERIADVLLASGA
jgi:UDP-N-acetylglucosamine 2-epimerase (non-hydrolysing)